MMAHRTIQAQGNIDARNRQLEQEKIEVREKMEGDDAWKKQLLEKEQKRRGIAVKFKDSHLQQVKFDLRNF